MYPRWMRSARAIGALSSPPSGWNALPAYRLYLPALPRCGYEKEAWIAIARLETQEKVSQIKADFKASAQVLEREGAATRGCALSGWRAGALAPTIRWLPWPAAPCPRWAALAQASLNQGDLANARTG